MPPAARTWPRPGWTWQPSWSFLARQPGVPPGKIAVAGESTGGEQALAAAGADPRIRAVIAEDATGQQLAGHGWRPRDTGRAMTRGMEWVLFTAAGLPSGAPRPVSIPDAIHAARGRPTLLDASAAAARETGAARWFQGAAPATAQLRPVPSAGHTQGLATAPRAGEAHVTGFPNAALTPRSPRSYSRRSTGNDRSAGQGNRADASQIPPGR